MKLSEIKLNPANPRIIKDDKFRKLIKSIKEFPKMMALRPIIVDDDGTILGGNMRYKALKELGYTDIPDEWVRKASELTDEEKRRFIIEDNVAFGDWDMDMLANEWDDELLNEWGLELPTISNEVEANEDDYEIPDEIKTDIVLGDLFEFQKDGKTLHRLLCGDSTDAEQVARLMNGEKADMVFTDPPYGMYLDTNYDSMFAKDSTHIKTGKRYEKVKGDNEDFNPEFINTIFSCFDYCKEIFIWGADYFSELIPNRNSGSWVVWDKRCDENMDKVSGNTFELCWSKYKHKRFVARILWSGHHGMQNDDTQKRVHPTQKPIKLAEYFFNKWGKENDLVADLFLGSGSTMVAAHQLNRKCYGMELDPKYCQVIIDRMLKLDNGLQILKNGIPYHPINTIQWDAFEEDIPFTNEPNRKNYNL